VANAVFDVLAGLLLRGHQPDSCDQKNNRYLGCSLHDQKRYHSDCLEETPRRTISDAKNLFACPSPNFIVDTPPIQEYSVFEQY